MQKFFNFYSNKRIAVTGASGFIGSCLLNELSKYSKTAYGISRRKTKIKNLKMLKVNLNNKNDLKNTVKKFDIFFYFAADTNLYRSEKNPHHNCQFVSRLKKILMSLCKLKP